MGAIKLSSEIFSSNVSAYTYGAIIISQNYYVDKVSSPPKAPASAIFLKSGPQQRMYGQLVYPYLSSNAARLADMS
jgi:hypothetical protein